MRLGGARRVGSASLVVLVGMVVVSRPKIIMKRGKPLGKAGTRTSGVEVAADEGQLRNAAIADGTHRYVEWETHVFAEQRSQKLESKYRAWTQTARKLHPSGRRWQSIRC